MNFKESVRFHLNRGEININEMALRHLKDTQKFWDKNDLDGVADKYIENALDDGISYSNILRGLTSTFKAKGLDHNKKNADKVKELITLKVKETQKIDKERKEKDARKPKSILIKKS